MEFSVAVLVMIASFLSPMSTSLAALATSSSGRIGRGVISDMAMAGDEDQNNAGFSGEYLIDSLSLFSVSAI